MVESTQELATFFNALQGGGNVALMLCVYFIREASQRLARIEMSLGIAMKAAHIINVDK
jgi:hypothetical protein